MNGVPDSWPLCGGELASPLEDIVRQSQVIHRWLVGAMLIAMGSASYQIWKESGGGSDHVLRDWIWASTGLYFTNASIGAIYVISWDIEEGFFELLSLVHLMLASLTFLSMATAWIGCVISTEEVE